ncbi:hypothetical protein [Stenotrophomonas chelatiphaga]|uniref:hypothetical protein n=1 Tax=Stenotrophomonas chelatiphaga TaxID=517011 RepID=UPI0028986B3E|nr:hypothetical protein [Stenotrophomonas chelatiphaga]
MMQQEQARGRLKLDRSQRMLHSLLQPAGTLLRLAPRTDPATLIVQEYVASLDVALDEGRQSFAGASALATGHTALDCVVFARTALRAARFIALSNARRVHPTVVVHAPMALLHLPCIPLWLARITAVSAIHAQALRVEIFLETDAAIQAHQQALLACGLAPIQVIDGACAVGDRSPLASGPARAQYCAAGPSTLPRSADSDTRRKAHVGASASLMTGIDSRKELERAVAAGTALVEGTMFALPAAVAQILKQVNAEQNGGLSPTRGAASADDLRPHRRQRPGA